VLGNYRSMSALCQAVAQNFGADGCSSVAKALTYQTLFALVPTIALAYMVLTAFDAFQGLWMEFEAFVFSNIVPDSVGSIQAYLGQFSEQAKSLSVPSLVILAASALWMLFTVEQSFNKIWRVARARHGVQRLLTYWAILTLAPLMLVATLAITTYVLSLPLISDVSDSPWILKVLPILFNCGLMALAFWLIPNTPVQIEHALLGGALASVLAEIAKWVFSSFIAASSFQVVYGAFATFPILLLWIYISWSIVLIGAELTKTLGYGHGESSMSVNAEEVMRHLQALLMFQEGFDSGRKKEAVLSQLNTQSVFIGRPAESTVESLIDAGLLVETDTDDVVLGKSLKDLTLGRFLASVKLQRPSAQELAVISASIEGGIASLASRWLSALSDEMQLLDVRLVDLLINEAATRSTEKEWHGT